MSVHPILSKQPVRAFKILPIKVIATKSKKGISNIEQGISNVEVWHSVNLTKKNYRGGGFVKREAIGRFIWDSKGFKP